MFARGSKNCRNYRKVPKPTKLAGYECPREIWLIGGIHSEHILVIGVTRQCPAEGVFTKKGPPRTVARTMENCPEQGGGGGCTLGNDRAIDGVPGFHFQRRGGGGQ